MAAETDKKSVLKSLLHELTKTKIVLDGQGRPSLVYSAPNSAVDGTPAICTEYIYANPSSTTIIASKETNAVWDSSWDADFTT